MQKPPRDTDILCRSRAAYQQLKSEAQVAKERETSLWEEAKKCAALSRARILIIWEHAARPTRRQKQKQCACLSARQFRDPKPWVVGWRLTSGMTRRHGNTGDANALQRLAEAEKNLMETHGNVAQPTVVPNVGRKAPTTRGPQLTK